VTSSCSSSSPPPTRNASSASSACKSTAPISTAPLVANPELRAKIQSAGLIKSLASVHFYNAYRNLPDKSIVLLRGDDAEALPTAAIVPIGKGRLILFGTAIDPTDRALDVALLEFIYRLAPEK
jgi:hypothetical protein